MRYYNDFGFKPYVSVAERRRNAAREMQKLKKNGHPVSPVVIEGRTIARTFWGKAWCDNLERYSDYANRVPRGRTYVRNGSVVDLQIAAGEVSAMVSGSELYKVAVKVSAVPKPRWTSICADSAGAIDSLVELLQGRFAKGVMERICAQKTGLFPAPSEIQFSCSCPDVASMCKHIAAVLYGIGARLDVQPELLFKLRRVDEKDLIANAGNGLRLSKRGPAEAKVLADDGLAALFGLDLGASTSTSTKAPRPRAAAAPKPATRSRRAKQPVEAKLEPKPKPTTRASSRPVASTRTKPRAKPTPKPASRAKQRKPTKRSVADLPR